MITVQIDPEAFATAGLQFSHEEGEQDAYFTFPPFDAPRPTKVAVRTDGTALRFFPERSGSHKAVLNALGISP